MADSGVAQTYEISSKCLRQPSHFGKSCFVLSSLWLTAFPLCWLFAWPQLSLMWLCGGVGRLWPLFHPSSLEECGLPGSCPAEGVSVVRRRGSWGPGTWEQGCRDFCVRSIRRWCRIQMSTTVGQKANTWVVCSNSPKCCKNKKC